MNKELKNLKDIFSMTDEEKQELVDRAAALRKSITEYFVKNEFRIDEILESRSYFICQDALDIVADDCKSFKFGNINIFPSYLMPHLVEYVKIETELKYKPTEVMFIPVNEGFILVDTSNLGVNWNLTIYTEELNIPILVGSKGRKAIYIKGYIDSNLNKAGRKAKCNNLKIADVNQPAKRKNHADR